MFHFKNISPGVRACPPLCAIPTSHTTLTPSPLQFQRTLEHWNIAYKSTTCKHPSWNIMGTLGTLPISWVYPFPVEHYQSRVFEVWNIMGIVEHYTFSGTLLNSWNITNLVSFYGIP